MFNCGANLVAHHEKVAIGDLIDSTQGNFVAHESFSTPIHFFISSS